MDKWDKYAKAVHRIERQYAPQFERVVLDYRLSVVEAIKEQGVQATQGRIGSELVNVPIQPIIQEIYRKGGLMGARMTYREIREAVKLLKRPKKSAHNLLIVKAGGFGLNESWIAAVLDFLKIHLLNIVSRIGETMRNDVLEILSEGIEKGWGVDNYVNKLQDKGLIRSRARVMVRTEVNGAANVGHAVGAQSLPYEVNKEWLTSLDGRERPSHRLVNGHIVDELGTFEVPVFKNGKPTGAVDKMQHPGDKTASLSNIVQCRCRVIYTAKVNELGEPILRPNATPARVIPMAQAPSADIAGIAAALRKAIKIGVD